LKSITTSSDKFCPLPFTHISSTNDGNYRVCCYSEETAIPKADGTAFNIRRDSVVEVWNSDFYKQLRTDLLNGVENSACSTCWKHEASGVYSKRQQSLAELKDFYTHGVTEPVPTLLDIKVGSLCNLKCITCYPGASSQHQAEVEQWRKDGDEVPGLIKMFDARLQKLDIDIRDYNPKTVNVETFINNLDPSLRIAKELSLVGGEPLVNPLAQAIIEHCVVNGYAKNMMLTMITNLTNINTKMLDNLSAFKHPMIMVSYDHIDYKKFGFIRYPADYKQFYLNLKVLMQNPKIELKLSTTISIFNVFDLPDIFNHFEHLSQRYPRRFIINTQYVMYPNYFSIAYLTQEQKDNIVATVTNFVKRFKDYKIFKDNPDMLQLVQSIGNYMNTEVTDYDEVVAERNRVLELYDRTRNTNFVELFPQLSH
jgi:MoaA/NifB/PqqE/SkfB family radical SAM enzyme